MLTASPKANLTRKRNGFTIVRIVLGVLLLAASGLKFADGDFRAAGVFGPFASPFWHLAAAEAEALLGGWLLLGAAPHILWLVTLLFFLGLASMSLYLGMEGQPSCGCFGASLAVSPWYTLGLDLTAVASLVWWRPPRQDRIEVLYKAGLVILFMSLLLSGVAVLSGVRYGSVAGGVTAMQGHVVQLEPALVDLGDLQAGETVTTTVVVRNLTTKPQILVGGYTTCKCAVVSDLPRELKPLETGSINVQVAGPSIEGSFKRTVTLFVNDSADQPMVVLSGRIVPR